MEEAEWLGFAYAGSPEDEGRYANENPNHDSDSSADHQKHDSASDRDNRQQNSVHVREMIANVWGDNLLGIMHEEGDALNAAEDGDYAGYDEDDGDNVYEELGTAPLRLIERVMHAPSSLRGLHDGMQDNGHARPSYVEAADLGSQPIRRDGMKRDDTTNNESADCEVASEAERDSTVVIPELSFVKLQESSLSYDTFLLNHSYERAHWRIIELVEVKETVERELQEAAKQYKFLQKEVSARRQDFLHKAEGLGISKELWDAYEAFCESMEPQFGSEEGFSIVCNEGHGGSYVEYDPELFFYKRFSDWDWSQHNVRCEASGSKVIEFWPVPYLAPDLEDVSTWSDIYPSLYELASEAAQNGSEAALDMLVALPDKEASFKGGWLFEYLPMDRSTCRAESIYGSGLIRAHPVKSRRWTYRSAHRVDSPEDAATKRESVRAALDLETWTL
ncbi:hypothetical protein O1611_g7997 [Lasiodiplodia mahajangana]|uniref:Uncharacterized protein n=1 Tax=Lasiodiplodia mahajangana TaxID=1108764 RepID=A0ACC2JE14_9PEZI|nr:hypothetical protein O1611_g7997 [Lasiodiplodia mahajangana]